MKRELMHAWLRCVAQSSARDELVLRGSLVTSFHCPTRIAIDVDHLALDPSFDEARMRARIETIATLDPTLEVTRHEVIWAETAFPGLRSFVRRGDLELQIDCGFGDPLAVEPMPIVVGGASLVAVRPETMVAWKLHGLFEFGRGRWRPKDLFDVWLYVEQVVLEDGLLAASLRAAFESRGTSLELTKPLREGTWGTSKGSQRKWAWLKRQVAQGDQEAIANDPLPDLGVVLARVKARLLPILSTLGV